ncbi:hypothetical protein [Streptomyces sp. KR80]|uniref:hypothetical protein n=1 Tax=Streptomyces sp. KR80 TaxID=3457426 RepID=UPI003FD3179C
MILPLWYRHGTTGPVPDPVPSPLVWAAALTGSLVILLVLGVTGGLHRSLLALATFGALAVILGLCGRAVAAPGTAAVCWLLYNGFVVVPQGELSWNGPVDATRLGLLIGLALLGTGIARVADAVGAYRRITPHATGRDTFR